MRMKKFNVCLSSGSPKSLEIARSNPNWLNMIGFPNPVLLVRLLMNLKIVIVRLFHLSDHHSAFQLFTFEPIELIELYIYVKDTRIEYYLCVWILPLFIQDLSFVKNHLALIIISLLVVNDRNGQNQFRPKPKFRPMWPKVRPKFRPKQCPIKCQKLREIGIILYQIYLFIVWPYFVCNS